MRIGLLGTLLATSLVSAAEDATTPSVWWSMERSPGAVVTESGPDSGASVRLEAGRIAISVIPDDERPPLVVSAGPLILEIGGGMVLVECFQNGAFVVALTGEAEVHGSGNDPRGVLLQSRQGIAVHPDQGLADVLTFERRPQLDDPLPLVDQAMADDDGIDWPTVEHILLTVAPIVDVAVVDSAATHGPAPRELDPADMDTTDLDTEDLAAQATDAAALEHREPIPAQPEPSRIPAEISVSTESSSSPTTVEQASTISSRNLRPPWQQRGRR